MLSKSRTRLIERLKSPRFRAREAALLVEGVRGVRELLQAPAGPVPRFALLSPRLEETEAGRALRKELEAGPLERVEVEDREMDLLSDTERSQGVLVVADEPVASLQALPTAGATRLLLLDAIQDPGNLGTMARAAWAFGLGGIVALEGTTDPWGPKAVRAGAGALFHLPVVRARWEEVEAWLGEGGVPILVADAGGEDVRRTRLPGSWALAVGNEGAGIRDEIGAAAARVLSIPMAPGVDSLNAGVAGALLMFALTLPPGAATEE